MLPIIKKEFNSFLDSLIAYLVISVFLIAISLFMWVLPGENILDNGFAVMDTLFTTGPYVFMFLIPAITMRSIAEEKKTGTIELLFTRPISDLEIVSGKFLAGFLLVIFSIIPTLIYYYSVYSLGNPVGNLDTPGIIGSYIGLIALAGVFTSIGILSSAASDNQISAFIISVFLCYIFYTGFSALASLDTWGKFSETINQMGIAYHYASISRGLVDSRDIIYFISVMLMCLFSANLVLSSRRWS